MIPIKVLLVTVPISIMASSSLVFCSKVFALVAHSFTSFILQLVECLHPILPWPLSWPLPKPPLTDNSLAILVMLS